MFVAAAVVVAVAIVVRVVSVVASAVVVVFAAVVVSISNSKQQRSVVVNVGRCAHWKHRQLELWAVGTNKYPDSQTIEK